MTDVQLTAWIDKLAITELLTRYFQLIDDKDFAAEKMQTLFTDHGTVTRPNGNVTTGPVEIARSNRKSFARFRATQHLPSGYVIEINGDEATVRVNVMAMHLWADGFGDPNALDRHFVGGIVIQGSARRTAHGWRLTDLTIHQVNIHPDFPEKVWVIVEQPRNEPYRLSYDPQSNRFMRTTSKSLIYERGFGGVYGWIGGMGTPPAPHYDILLLTKQYPHVGDILLGYVCGVFLRGDGDHKFVAIDAEWRKMVSQADLSALDQATYDELTGLYPQIGENEGWYGAKAAQSYLRENPPTHD